MKYKVAVSGWAIVEVEAENIEQAEEIVMADQPDIAGELYGLEVHETIPVEEAFQMHTDLN